jgi:hypothetical protein
VRGGEGEKKEKRRRLRITDSRNSYDGIFGIDKGFY